MLSCQRLYDNLENEVVTGNKYLYYWAFDILYIIVMQF